MKVAVASKTAIGIRKRSKGGYHIHIHKPDHASFKDLESSTPWHVAFAFLIPVLFSAVQVHYQGSNKSPFETHLPNMLAFLLAILVYCFALVYYLTSLLQPISTAVCSKLSAQVALISGSLASASLISVLPPRFLEPVIFIVWILLSAYVARNSILQMGRSLLYSLKNVVSCICTTWRQITRNNNDGATTVTA